MPAQAGARAPRAREGVCRDSPARRAAAGGVPREGTGAGRRRGSPGCERLADGESGSRSGPQSQGRRRSGRPCPPGLSPFPFPLSFPSSITKARRRMKPKCSAALLSSPTWCTSISPRPGWRNGVGVPEIKGGGLPQGHTCFRLSLNSTWCRIVRGVPTHTLRACVIVCVCARARTLARIPGPPSQGTLHVNSTPLPAPLCQDCSVGYCDRISLFGCGFSTPPRSKLIFCFA